MTSTTTVRSQTFLSSSRSWKERSLPKLRSLTTSSLPMVQAASASWFCVSAALDTVCHTVLPNRLSASPLLSWFHSYLFNRQQCCFRRLAIFSFLWMAGSTSLGGTRTLKHSRSNSASVTNSCFSPLHALAPQYLSELPPCPYPSGTLPIKIRLVPTLDSETKLK